jgi:hypothetical protein
MTRLVAAGEDFGVQVDLSGPLDRPALGVDRDLLEDLAFGASYAAGGSSTTT